MVHIHVRNVFKPSLLSGQDWSDLLLGLLVILIKVKVPCPNRIDAARTLTHILRSSTNPRCTIISACNMGASNQKEGKTTDACVPRAAVEQVVVYALTEIRQRLSKESERQGSQCYDENNVGAHGGVCGYLVRIRSRQRQ